jgi:hypothetical protein
MPGSSWLSQATHLREANKKTVEGKSVKAAAITFWTYVLFLAGIGCAEALTALEPPKMGVVRASPEMVWPLEERLSLPYVPSGDEAPACAPVIARPSSAARISTTEEAEQSSRTTKHRHGGRWRKGGELAGAPSYSEAATKGARRSHARREMANPYHSRSSKPVQRPNLTSRAARGKASAGRVRAEFLPHGPLTR